MTLRLHLNEHGDCSPAVLRALAAMRPCDIACYADDDAARERIARWFGVRDANVLPVNGLDEGLLLASQLAGVRARGPFDGVVVEPAFEVYASVIATSGGTVRCVDPRPDLAVRADDVLARCSAATRVIYLCDPGNPSGVGIDRRQIEAILDAMPRAIVVVDEAYADFSGRTMIGSALDTYPHLVVGRTFSKAYGLAGLRIGALVGAAGIIAELRRIALPYRLNAAAIAAVGAALDDRAYLDRAIEVAVGSRRLLVDAARRLGFETWPSEANFVLMRIGRGAEACATFLRARGVLVRDRSSLPGCAGCLRITAGRAEEVRRAIALMEEWHATQPR